MPKIETKEYLDYADVLIKPCKSSIKSRKDVDLIRQFTSKYSNQKINIIPIMISNMDTVGTFEMASAVDEFNIITCFHKFYSLVDYIKFYKQNKIKSFNFVTVGLNQNNIKFLKSLEDNGLFTAGKLGINLDVANGYMNNFTDFVYEVRKLFPNVLIQAGNICTPDIIKYYNESGVDIIKVGIGNGAQCRTREVAGVGIPQLTAIIDCMEEASKYNLAICADGGINEIADFSKALGVADFAMSGSMFGGHTESAGEIVTQNNKQYKKIYGMSSSTAMNKYYSSDISYRSSEGRTSLIPYRGSVKQTIQDILGGIRSTMTYTNSSNIMDLQTNIQFIRVKSTINNLHLHNTISH